MFQPLRKFFGPFYYHRLLLTALMSVLFWVAVPTLPVYAATITVNSTADVIADDGLCTLREAITAANTNTASGAMTGECPAGDPGADTIVVPAGTYTLAIAGTGNDNNATGDLDITEDLTISGAGAATTTIDANGLDRALHIIGGSTVVTIEDITVQNGAAGAASGGGVLHAGNSLTINDSVFDSNTAATSTGGAIASSATLDVNGSLFTGNSSGSGGGGITVLGGTTNVTNSTFNSNASSTQGGAIRVNSGGTLNARNSTFYDNTSGNGSAIRNNSGGTANLYNSIFHNTTPTDGHCNGITVASNLRSDGTCGETANTVTNFEVTLRDNGGPTQTHAVLPGSNAIDTGDNTVCAAAPVNDLDQRDEPRPVDYDLDSTATCDMGAFERQADESAVMTVPAGTAVTFGATMVTIEDNGAAPIPGVTTVTRFNQPPGGGTPDAGEMPFHVTIDAATSTGLDVDLTLCYTDWELTHGTTAVDQADLVFFRYDGATWVNMGVTTLDTTNNCATLINVGELGEAWTLADPDPGGPTAIVLLGQRADLSGNTAAAGAVVLVALVATSLLLLSRRKRRTAV